MHKSDKIETLKFIFGSRGSEVRILSPRPFLSKKKLGYARILKLAPPNDRLVRRS